MLSNQSSQVTSPTVDLPFSQQVGNDNNTICVNNSIGVGHDGVEPLIAAGRKPRTTLLFGNLFFLPPPPPPTPWTDGSVTGH